MLTLGKENSPSSCACQSSGVHSLTDWENVSHQGKGSYGGHSGLGLGLALLYARLPLWAEHSQAQCHAGQLLLYHCDQIAVQSNLSRRDL